MIFKSLFLESPNRCVSIKATYADIHGREVRHDGSLKVEARGMRRIGYSCESVNPFDQLSESAQPRTRLASS
jgi:hypothetical protein